MSPAESFVAVEFCVTVQIGIVAWNVPFGQGDGENVQWGRAFKHMGLGLVSKSNFTNRMGTVFSNFSGRGLAASVPQTPDSAIRGGITLGILPFCK